MKQRLFALPRLCLLLGTGAIAPHLYGGGLFDFIFSKNDLQTITVTDVTPAGKTLPQPSPAHPLYYAGISAGYRDLGGMKAGEKPIAREQVNQLILKALAKQGYLPVTPDRHPDVFLVWSWGTLNKEMPFGPWALSVSTPLNHYQLLRFLGGEKLGMISAHPDPFPELSLATGLFRSSEEDNLADAAMDDLYIAVVSAYTVDAAKPGKPVLLWNTRIGCPARGSYLPEALPAMIAIATPYIGRDTPKPVWIHATEKFRPEIKLGDPRVVEYLEAGKHSLVEIGPSK
jgi:hypothetical protein